MNKSEKAIYAKLRAAGYDASDAGRNARTIELEAEVKALKKKLRAKGRKK